MNKICNRLAGTALVVILSLQGAPGIFAQNRKALPEDNGMALVNPGMGWMVFYYSNVLENYGSKLEPSDIVEDFPGMSTVFLRLPWSFVEPEKDKFNWEIIDTPAQRWLEKGRQVAFCGGLDILGDKILVID